MVESATHDTRKLDLRIQLICLWCGPVALLTFLVFMWGVAGFLPPRSAEWSADELARWYDDNRTEIRVGQVGALAGGTLLFPFWLVVCSYVRECERGRMPILYRVDLSAATMNFIFLQIPSLAWLVCTFRTDADPQTLQSWHDFGWFCFLMPFGAYTLNLLSQGVAILTDRSPDPTWPRWLGYFNLMLLPTTCLGGLIVFFKSGPLAWDGIFAFYGVLVCFATWIIVVTAVTHRTLRRRMRALAVTDTPVGVPATATAGPK